MSYKFISIILSSLLLLGLAFLLLNPELVANKSSSTSKKSDNTQPFLKPVPSPTIVINENTNLLEATKQLTPNDFSEDYQELKQEIQQF